MKSVSFEVSVVKKAFDEERKKRETKEGSRASFISSLYATLPKPRPSRRSASLTWGWIDRWAFRSIHRLLKIRAVTIQARWLLLTGLDAAKSFTCRRDKLRAHKRLETAPITGPSADLPTHPGHPEGAANHPGTRPFPAICGAASPEGSKPRNCGSAPAKLCFSCSVAVTSSLIL